MDIRKSFSTKRAVRLLREEVKSPSLNMFHKYVDVVFGYTG